MKIEWLKASEVAAQLRVSTGTLSNWRSQGIGPNYTKLTPAQNAPVRYKKSDIDAYLAQQERGVAA
ncbi:AlpA family transcriptional regulator [Streptomyces sp. CC210A]|uniref:helix-turn-helix transcriptional regulator n=1 Tax=Streptomyces sp. CC210A TaxID=2898184 RepID=UPI001F22AA03|nr:helix-turn-helix domain-containing protein [Streptomyces sp. CC210A]